MDDFQGNELFLRASVRAFENRPVEDQKVEQLLRAAMQAPSAGNQQPWEFYLVTDEGTREALSQTSPYAGPAAKAPLDIVLAYRTEGLRFPEFAQIDMAIAQENMWLESTRLGLGGVWLGIAPLRDRMGAVHRVVGMPDELEAFSIFAVGYPAQKAVQRNRFDQRRIHRL